MPLFFPMAEHILHHLTIGMSSTMLAINSYKQRNNYLRKCESLRIFMAHQHFAMDRFLPRIFPKFNYDYGLCAP